MLPWHGSWNTRATAGIDLDQSVPHRNERRSRQACSTEHPESCRLPGCRRDPMQTGVTLIYLVAGEPSGDVLGGRLMAALRQARPGLTFAGVGGPRMAEQGLLSVVPMHELTVIGFLEAVPRLARLRALLRQLADDVAARRPAVLVTIDSPGFTLRLLRMVGAGSIARVHYVAPQVWAWHRGRVKKFPGLWDRLLCLLPFEPDFFASDGLPATFVGHP